MKASSKGITIHAARALCLLALSAILTPVGTAGHTRPWRARVVRVEGDEALGRLLQCQTYSKYALGE